MGKKQEYTCVSYIRGADGNLIEFSTLTDEQKQQVRARITENISRMLGTFLTEHPEELESLRNAESVQLIPEGTEREEESA